jgi:hypothetical protein
MATTAPEPFDDSVYVPDIVWVSPEEGRRMFDEAAREWAGMSGEEFIRRYEAGEYADMVESEDNRHIVDLVLMIPLARQNS